MLLTYRFAQQDDLPTVVDLVNAAYRGDESYPGWTHEGHLLEGDRVSIAQLALQLSEPRIQMLLAQAGGELKGCMMLSQQPQQVYLGTFAVVPHQQGQGLGRQILEQAEWLASVKWQAHQIEMVVITQRQDLIAYYQRRGYQLSGDFPIDLDVGIAKVEGLTLTSLTKQL